MEIDYIEKRIAELQKELADTTARLNAEFNFQIGKIQGKIEEWETLKKQASDQTPTQKPSELSAEDR